MYIRPRRQYRNKKTGETSPLIYEVAKNCDKLTLRNSFNCGLRRGTWFDTPFEEIETVPAMETLPAEIRKFKPVSMSLDDAIPAIFDTICDIVEESWQPDKLHIAFHSSGWDSRIISAAIRRLIGKNGQSWVKGDLLFLSNRWEEKETTEILKRIDLQDYLVVYNNGSDDEHFSISLDIGTFWKTTNAPLPIPGNLWWYLPEYAKMGNGTQAYAGLYANETWNHFKAGGLKRWLERFESQYYYNILAMLPSPIDTIEYPLSDLRVLKIVAGIKTKLGGDALRQAVAEYANPAAKDVPHLTLDDRNHPISRRLQKHCVDQVNKTWYGRRMKSKFVCPQTSEFSIGWCQFGMASLCEKLISDGVKIK